MAGHRFHRRTDRSLPPPWSSGAQPHSHHSELDRPPVLILLPLAAHWSGLPQRHSPRCPSPDRRVAAKSEPAPIGARDRVPPYRLTRSLPHDQEDPIQAATPWGALVHSMVCHQCHQWSIAMRLQLHWQARLPRQPRRHRQPHQCSQPQSCPRPYSGECLRSPPPRSRRPAPDLPPATTSLLASPHRELVRHSRPRRPAQRRLVLWRVGRQPHDPPGPSPYRSMCLRHQTLAQDRKTLRAPSPWPQEPLGSTWSHLRVTGSLLDRWLSRTRDRRPYRPPDHPQERLQPRLGCRSPAHDRHRHLGSSRRRVAQPALLPSSPTPLRLHDDSGHRSGATPCPNARSSRQRLEAIQSQGRDPRTPFPTGSTPAHGAPAAQAPIPDRELPCPLHSGSPYRGRSTPGDQQILQRPPQPNVQLRTIPREGPAHLQQMRIRRPPAAPQQQPSL
jgi:hypothetical protein